MVDFASIADKKPEQVERPPLVPAGSYIALVHSYDIGEVSSEKGNWDRVNFRLAIQSPLDDVDPDDIAAFKGNLQGQMLERTFMFDKNDESSFVKTENQLKRFLQDHVGVWKDGEPLKKAMEDAKGQPLMIVVSHRPDKNDPEVFYANVQQTGPAD